MCPDSNGCRRPQPYLGPSCIGETLVDSLGHLRVVEKKDICASVKRCDMLAEVPVS